MAYVHEIKFYRCPKSNELKVALFDQPPFFGNEFWIKNISASELGFLSLPKGLKLEQKYKLESLGIKPFPASKPEFDFIDKCAEIACNAAKQAVMSNLPLPPL
jgi:hypothetical protein